MRGRRDDEANPGESVGEARAPIRQEIAGGEKALPALGALGRPERFAHQVEPRALYGVGRASRNVGDVIAANAELVQQLSHAGLRVLRVSGKARPLRIIESAVESGQHHRAVWQRRDYLEQPRSGRDGAG